MIDLDSLDPDEWLDDGRTPLHHAAERFDEGASVAALLARGADPRRRARDGCGPLWSAVRGDAEHAIPLLARAGADLSELDPEGRLLLPTVVRWRNTGAAEALVRAGARPDQAEPGGASALSIGLERGDFTVLEAMLGAGPAREALAARPHAQELATRKALVLRALREGKTYYRSNHEGWTELSFSQVRGAFVENGGGEGGDQGERVVGGDDEALEYLYQREAFASTSEREIWTQMLVRWGREP
jgi:ankyrin repeat protein